MENEIRARLLSLKDGQLLDEVFEDEDLKENDSRQEQEDDSEMAKEKKQVAELLQCVNRLEMLEALPTVSKRAMEELLVLCAEVGLGLKQDQVAQRMVDEYFIKAKTKNQLYCRGLFVRALLVHSGAAQKSGQALVDDCLKAIGLVTKVLDICLDPIHRGSYNFLVYNASVHMWTLTRPLLRDGLRGYAVPGLSQAAEALKKTNDQGLVWRARLSMTLALALEEKGDTAAALAAIKEAVALFQEALEKSSSNISSMEEESSSIASKQQITRMLDDAKGIMIHLGKQGSLSAAKSDKASGNFKSTLQCIRSSIIQGKEVIQKELEECLDILLKRAQREGEAGQQNLDPEKIDMYSLLQIGRVAAENQCFDVAKKSLQTGLSIPNRYRNAANEVSLDLLKAEWLAEAPDATFEGFENDWEGHETFSIQSILEGKIGLEREKALNALLLAKRIKALKTIERAIVSSTRLNSPSLVEEACVLMWNIGLPLLQPNLSKHIHKPFQTASSALEEIDSPLKELRAHFHGEIAKCEVSSDFLTKANVQVEKALNMDYGELQQEQRKGLDEFLQPLQQKLRLKSNLYHEPEKNFEQAILLVEQAKDARENHLRISLLTRATGFLKDISQTTTDEEKGREEEQSSSDESSLLMMAKQIVLLWGEIAESAWEIRAFDLTISAITKTLELAMEENSKIRNSPEIQRLCSKMHFMLAETYAERVQLIQVDPLTPTVLNLNVKALGLQVPTVVPPPADWEEPEDYVRNITTQEQMELIWPLDYEQPFEPELLELKRGVIQHILSALHIGVEMKEVWIIENAATYMWNYHLHMFNGPLQRFRFMIPSLIKGLAEVHQVLETNVDPLKRNVQLFCNISLALAQGLEGMVLALESNEDEENVDETSIKLLGKTNADKLNNAVRVCKSGIACNAALGFTKDLLSTLHRIQRTRKTNEPLPADPSQAAYCVIELLRLPVETISKEEKKNLLLTTITNLETKGEESAISKDLMIALEIWTRLGREAFEWGLLKEAETCVSKTMSFLPSQKSQREKFSPSAWRWFSLAESLWGSIVATRAEHVTHDKSTQDSLREESMRHICAGGAYGVKSKIGRLVSDASKEFWNVALHLMGSSGARSLLFEPLQAMLKHLRRVEDMSDIPLRVNLYCALFECFKDKKDWSGGLQAVQEAFKVIPQQFQKRLWEARVIFSSKLNKDVAAGLHKMKEGSNSLQAKAWATLARSSANQGDQMNAYIQAVELLKDSFEKVDYVIEFAEWLHANHFPRDDVTQCLLSAADALLDVQRAADEADIAAAAANALAEEGNNGTGGGATSPTSIVSYGSKRTQRTVASRFAIGRSQTIEKERQLGDPCIDAPKRLNFGLRLKLVQIFTMLSRSVPHSRIRCDMALLAHEHLLAAWKLFIFKDEDLDKVNDASSLLEKVILAASNADLALKRQDQVGTVEKLPVILYYLFQLGNLLQECGQHVPSLCSFAMLEFLGLASKDRPYQTLAALKTVHGLIAVNLIDMAKTKMCKVDIEMDEVERLKYSIEVDQILQQQKHMRVEDSSQRDAMETTTMLKPNALPPTKRKLLEKMKIREVWALLATELIKLGYVYHAKLYLEEAKRHNKAYCDHENAVRVSMAEARIGLLEGKDDISLRKSLEAIDALRKSGGGNILEWLHNVQLVCECLLQTGQSVEARLILKQAVDVFERMNVRYQKDLDFEVAFSYLETQRAEFALKEAQAQAAEGGMWEEQWYIFQKQIRDAQDRILIATKPNCASIAAVDILVKHCSLWLQVFQNPRLRLQQEAFKKIMDGLTRASRCAETMLQLVGPTSKQLCADLSLNLPLERLIGNIQIILGTVEYMYVEFCESCDHEQAEDGGSMSNGYVKNEAAAKVSIIQKYLDATAPERSASLEEIAPDAMSRACTHMMSAYVHIQNVTSLKGKGLLAAGTGLARAGEIDQSNELLEEAITRSLATKDFQIMGLAALELAKNTKEINHLLLYQSCQTRKFLSGILESVALDKRGKLRSFGRLRKHIEQELINPDLFPLESTDDDVGEEVRQAWPLNRCKRFEKQSIAMKRLDCSKDVESILKVLPSKIGVLVLSLCPDQSTLLSTFFTKTTRKDLEIDVSKLGARAVDRLRAIALRMPSYRKRLSSQLLGHSNESDYDFLDGNHHQNEKEDASSPASSSSSVPDRLEEELVAMIDEVQAILGPILDATFQRYLNILRDKEGQVKGEGELDLLILADDLFNRLPIESIMGASDDERPTFKAMMRDFSIHVWNHRLDVVMTNKPAGNQEKDGGDIEPTFASKPSKVNYIVDPLNQEQSLTERFQTLKSGEWQGVTGKTDGIPSRGRWQQLLNAKDPCQFFYLGLAPLFAEVDANAISGLNLGNCWAAILLDRASNDISFRRQCKEDGRRTPSELQLEDPVETAAILTLCGVNAILLNQWTNSIHANLRLAAAVCESASKKGAPGSSLSQTLTSFLSRRDENEPELKKRVKCNPITYGLPI